MITSKGECLRCGEWCYHGLAQFPLATVHWLSTPWCSDWLLSDLAALPYQGFWDLHTQWSKSRSYSLVCKLTRGPKYRDALYIDDCNIAITLLDSLRWINACCSGLLNSISKCPFCQVDAFRAAVAFVSTLCRLGDRYIWDLWSSTFMAVLCASSPRSSLWIFQAKKYAPGFVFEERKRHSRGLGQFSPLQTKDRSSDSNTLNGNQT